MREGGGREGEERGGLGAVIAMETAMMLHGAQGRQAGSQAVALCMHWKATTAISLQRVMGDGWGAGGGGSGERPHRANGEDMSA